MLCRIGLECGGIGMVDIIGLIVVMALFFSSVYLDTREERKWSRWQS